jgi:hypothetical protein
MWNISMHASRTLLRTSVLALCALPMHGQTANTGPIAGTVSDPSGALVPRPAVVINSQGRASGTCPVYVVDHIVPLKRGGADKPENMQWQTKETAKAKGGKAHAPR